jgi:hypothetical protein
MKILNKSLFKKLLNKNTTTYFNKIVCNTISNKNTQLIKLNKYNFCDNKNKQEDFEEDEQNFHLPHDESNTYLKTILTDMNCKGCGVNLQYEHKDKIGYIPELKIKEYFEGEQKSKENENPPLENKKDSEIHEFEKIADFK